MDAVKDKAGVGTNAHGLCFYMPVEMSTLNNLKEDTEKTIETDI